MHRMGADTHSSTLSAEARRGRAKGLTLLEIMIVIAIVGLISSVIVVAVINQFERAKIKTTRLKLKSIESALKQYSVDHELPSQGEGLRLLVSPPDGGKAYLKDAPKDAWHNNVLYFNPARTGSDPFELVSRGPDGKEGTDDDVYVTDQRSQR